MSILLHIIIIIIILFILLLSIYQYKHYDILKGVMVCSDNMNSCSIAYKNKDEETVNLLRPYKITRKNGTFSVKIAVDKKDQNKYYILGTKGKIFFGTKFKIIMYFILLGISIISFFYLIFLKK